ncbi:MAG: hypothetical protein OXT74_10740 [Candidatus Poribacteria bacterium]|nr:hypothetical protein [Candidatus Poribacteria bacterium]
MPDVIWVLELRGILLSSLMARNALKSNVTWSSYPFIPPTGTSGFFADVLGGMKWYEINDNCVRHLHQMPECQGIFALGGYPVNQGQMSRRHFRNHLGDMSFNYEAYVWPAGRGHNKKLAVIEEFLADELRFVIVSRDSESLHRLYESIRGSIAPIAKKSSVQLEFSAEPMVTRLELDSASGAEQPMTVMPFMEIGNLPNGLLPYLVPLRSEGTSKGIRWHTQHCAWQYDLRFRDGTSIYRLEERGISQTLLKDIGFFD